MFEARSKTVRSARCIDQDANRRERLRHREHVTSIHFGPSREKILENFSDRKLVLVSYCACLNTGLLSRVFGRKNRIIDGVSTRLDLAS